MSARLAAWALAVLACACACTLFGAGDDAGKIMRPTDGAALASDQVDIIATAPEGKLMLDGNNITAEQPFPNVFHAVLKTSPGPHSLAVVWNGGRKEIQFFVGPNAPAPFQAFRPHPLAGVECTKCHELTKRGRFHFKEGACFECHQRETFAKVHTHTPDVLRECGLCHNAHGSTVKANLLYPKETACKQCHN